MFCRASFDQGRTTLMQPLSHLSKPQVTVLALGSFGMVLAHARANTIPKLPRANTVTWGLLRWDRGCMRVVRPWSKLARQNMASRPSGVGHLIPHNIPP